MDGSAFFKDAGDQRNEDEVAAQIEERWRCRLTSFGGLAPIDWYAVRDERLVGVLELKTRTHGRLTYPTVFLNVRKWLALTLAAQGMGVPAIFVVRFTDWLGWINVAAVDASRVRLAGWRDPRPHTRNDLEPVIEVPVEDLAGLEAV